MAGRGAALPDGLYTIPASPFHNAELLERGVGIKFTGVDRNNVEEYCVSEGWVRMAVGKTVDRHGNAMTVKYKGKVEPYLRQPLAQAVHTRLSLLLKTYGPLAGFRRSTGSAHALCAPMA